MSGPLDQVWTGREVSRLIHLLNEGRQQFVTVLELLSTGIAVVAADLTVNHMNRRFAGRLGGQPEGLEAALGSLFPEFQLRQAVQRAVEGREAASTESFDGSGNRLRLTVQPLNVPGTEALLTLEADEGGAAGGDLAEHAPDAIVAFDARGRIQFANRTWERLTGWSREELLHSRLEELGAEKLPAGGCPAGLLPGPLHCYDLKLAAKNGRQLWFEVRETGSEKGIQVAVAREVSATRAAQAAAVTERTAAAAERVSGYVAHRLNNQLTVSLSYTETVLRRFGSAESLRADLETVIASLREASEVTGMLLSLSGGLPLKISRIDFDSFLNGLRPLLDSVAGGALRYSLALETAAEVLADTNQLESAVLNLLSEVRELHPSGEIAVATRLPDRELADRCGLVLRPDDVALVIECPGLRLTPEQTAQAFEALTEVGGHTNIRFPIARSIVRRMKGQVGIGADGSGTIVCLTLPKAPTLSK